MDANKFEKDLKDYKEKLSKKLDEQTVNLMLHAFCMGYCQLSTELNEEFGAYIDLDPVFDKINELNPLITDIFCIEKQFIFTPENLIENIDRLGPWSSYGLASEALKHYFPKMYDEDGYCDIIKEVELLKKLGFVYWNEVIVKYQTEVGYKAENGFNPDCVNEK